MSDLDARLCADTLVQADLWGHQSHGAMRLATLPGPDPYTSYHCGSPLKYCKMIELFASDELSLAVAERPVFAFHFDEIDY
jgi:hypothetical protein